MNTDVFYILDYSPFLNLLFLWYLVNLYSYRFSLTLFILIIILLFFLPSIKYRIFIQLALCCHGFWERLLLFLRWRTLYEPSLCMIILWHIFIPIIVEVVIFPDSFYFLLLFFLFFIFFFGLIIVILRYFMKVRIIDSLESLRLTCFCVLKDTHRPLWSIFIKVFTFQVLEILIRIITLKPYTSIKIEIGHFNFCILAKDISGLHDSSASLRRLTTFIPEGHRNYRHYFYCIRLLFNLLFSDFIHLIFAARDQFA
jgi:hypothetical protein